MIIFVGFIVRVNIKHSREELLKLKNKSIINR